MRSVLRGFVLLIVLLPNFWVKSKAQAPPKKLDPIEVEHARGMLRDARDEVKKNYYDPTFHGIDLDARYREYDEGLQHSHSLSELLQTVAAFLSGFNDSHLFFLPPPRTSHFDAGYRMEMVGDKCLVTRTRPKSDASTKLHPGDQILQFNQYAVTREDLHNIQFYFHVLTPYPQETLIVRSPDGTTRKVTIQSMMKLDKSMLDLTEGNDIFDILNQEDASDQLNRDRVANLDGVTVWKMAEFGFDNLLLDGVLEGARTRPYLIVDLRGNPGGYTDSLQYLVGRVFDHDVKISDRVTRKPDKPQFAKHASKPYTGKLIVLIDSGSASSSELFARVIQLEHRGIVIGDRSAGAVMEARQLTDNQGGDTKIFYGFSVTRANLLMADGKSLEGVGVTPDEALLPTDEDLLAGRDPVLARALEIAGLKVDPVAAGKLFPYEWAPF